MICSRCAHWNNEDEHRCTKCAARLNDRQVESAFHSRGALALQVSAEPSSIAVMEHEVRGPVLESVSEIEIQGPRIPRYVTALQQSLFALREAGKVVSIDGGETEAEPTRRTARRIPPAGHRRRQATASYLPQQGVLEFVPMAVPQARKLATSVDARIYCEHQVASVTHRLIASLFDIAIVGLLVTVFLGLLYWGCDDLSSALADPIAVAVLAAAAMIIGLLYQSIFLAVRGDTPGMQFAGLRLVDFDGRPTSESQMNMRILGAFFSVLPAGVGLLWALVDEESLTWQDHISRTFPTPIATE